MVNEKSNNATNKSNFDKSLLVEIGDDINFAVPKIRLRQLF